MTTVFVSGATGFIAQHIIKALIADGYQVIGSVRSSSKGDHLKTLFTKGFDYTVVPDVGKSHAFDEVLQKHPEITAFFHTASPFHYNRENVEDNILKPAVYGTRNALTSAKAYGKNVKRFIVTSSIAAVASTILVDKTLPPDTLINESTWTEISWEQATADPTLAYSASKALAEKEAWRFIKEEKPQFELVSINPSFVFGPQAFDSEVKETLNTSSEFINSFLKLKANDPLPAYKGRYIDVRDVAHAHLVALKSDEAVGQRLLTQNGNYNSQLIANVLHTNFKELQDTVPLFDESEVNETLQHAAFGILDDSKSRKILGYQPISFDKTVVDSASQILKLKTK